MSPLTNLPTFGRRSRGKPVSCCGVCGGHWTGAGHCDRCELQAQKIQAGEVDRTPKGRTWDRRKRCEGCNAALGRGIHQSAAPHRKLCLSCSQARYKRRASERIKRQREAGRAEGSPLYGVCACGKRFVKGHYGVRQGYRRKCAACITAGNLRLRAKRIERREAEKLTLAETKIVG